MCACQEKKPTYADAPPASVSTPAHAALALAVLIMMIVVVVILLDGD